MSCRASSRASELPCPSTALSRQAQARQASCLVKQAAGKQGGEQGKRAALSKQVAQGLVCRAGQAIALSKQVTRGSEQGKRTALSRQACTATSAQGKLFTAASNICKAASKLCRDVQVSCLVQAGKKHGKRG